MATVQIPAVTLSTGHPMPVLAMGTASVPPPPPELFRTAMLDAVALGYRHFDTASMYGNEELLGSVIREAIELGLVSGRHELFITTKLWPTDAFKDRVVPALHQSLRSLQLEYVDLYLVHWPLCLSPEGPKYPIDKDRLLPMDMKSVWNEMEKCKDLGLAKSIGVSNFTCKKLEQLLEMAKIPPAVNQVELHPVWQQKKLINFCKEKDILVTAYSPLGGNNTPWGTQSVMECDVLKEIAKARGKTLPQVSFRWIYEQGAGIIPKSFKKERMIENASIFNWELSEEDLDKIRRIPQARCCRGQDFVCQNGPFRSIEELWDGEI